MLNNNFKYHLEVPISYETFKEKSLNKDIPNVFPIKSNTILYKTVTGLGATYNEITANRNSIIILPYLAVIKSKHEYHETKHNTFAVHGKVSTEEIVNYLADDGSFKKFLTTPKGLQKIIEACNQTSRNYKEKFFLLIDECHKLIQDANYRGDLIDIMEDFFGFVNKAMVSATPIPPSDPRFEKQGFQNIKLYPVYGHRKKVRLIVTNSILSSLKEVIAKNKAEHICIFFNSVTGIRSLINQLKLEDNYNIYCSEESTNLLKLDGEANAYNTLRGFKQFNFFTSSLFNGIDIIMPTSPKLVLITDKSYRDHALLDPLTDVLQIIGRFRDEDLSATHIHNADKSTYPLSELDALRLIHQSKAVYEAINVVKRSQGDLGLDEIFDHALKAVRPYSSLLNQSGDYSFFLGDNFINEARIAHCYKSPTSLKAAYLNSDLYFLEEERDSYEKSEATKLAKSSIRYSSKIIRYISELLQSLDDYKGLTIYNREREEIGKLFPLVLEGFDRLGYQRLTGMSFKKRLIEEALSKTDIDEKKNSLPMLNLIYKKFKLNKPYLSADIKTSLQQLYDSIDLKRKAKSTDLEKYFFFKQYNKYFNGRSNRAYIFTDRRFDIPSRK